MPLIQGGQSVNTTMRVVISSKTSENGSLQDRPSGWTGELKERNSGRKFGLE